MSVTPPGGSGQGFSFSERLTLAQSTLVELASRYVMGAPLGDWHHPNVPKLADHVEDQIRAGRREAAIGFTAYYGYRYGRGEDARYNEVAREQAVATRQVTVYQRERALREHRRGHTQHVTFMRILDIDATLRDVRLPAVPAIDERELLAALHEHHAVEMDTGWRHDEPEKIVYRFGFNPGGAIMAVAKAVNPGSLEIPEIFGASPYASQPQNPAVLLESFSEAAVLLHQGLGNLPP
jgi:hypothetical protein